MEYLLIGVFILYLAFKYDYNIYDSQDKWKWYKILFLVLTLFVGLRYRIGLDTVRYLLHFYEDTPELYELVKFNWRDTSVEPLYLLFVSFTKTVFGRFVFVQLFQAAFVNYLVFKYIKKHTKYIFTCAFIYFIWRFLPFTTEEMRASMAVVITLFANDYAIEGKKFKSILLYVIAFGFHTSAIFLVFLPFVLFFRFNKRGYLLLFSSFAIGIVVQTIFGDLLEMMSFTSKLQSQAQTYDNSALSGQTLNIKGIISMSITYLVYTFLAVRHIKRTQQFNISSIEPFLIWGLFFVVVSIPVSLMYRYTRFFDVYFIILYAQLIGEKVELNISSLGDIRIKPYLLFVPFFFLVLYGYTSSAPTNNQLKNYMRLYPYESVITKETDINRERLFQEYGAYYFDNGNY